MGEITRKKKKINWFMVMLLVPALAMLTVTIIIPVFVVVGMSFFHYNLLDMSNIKWNNFSNYKAVFTDAEFIRTFGRTLVYVCGTVIAQFFIGLGVALLLNSGSLRGRKVFRSLLFLPWTIPSLVVAVTWMFIFQPQYGIVNYLLGLGDYSVLGSPKTAMLGVIISAVWKQMPLMMIMLLSGLQTVPEDLKEADRRSHRSTEVLVHHSAVHHAGCENGDADLHRVEFPDVRSVLHHDRRRSGPRDHYAAPVYV